MFNRNAAALGYCIIKVFNKLLTNPDIQFGVVIVPEHEDPRTGRFYPATKWIEAYIPTRF